MHWGSLVRSAPFVACRFPTNLLLKTTRQSDQHASSNHDRVAELSFAGDNNALSRTVVGRISDATLNLEQWQQRVEEARRRSQEFVANARRQAGRRRPLPDFQETEAIDRAIKNPTLRLGDIVATKQGFVRFIGREEVQPAQGFRASSGAAGIALGVGIGRSAPLRIGLHSGKPALARIESSLTSPRYLIN
jgi:hypothetical protein